LKIGLQPVKGQLFQLAFCIGVRIAIRSQPIGHGSARVRQPLWQYGGKHATIASPRNEDPMAAIPAPLQAKARLKVGLRAWMDAALVECERAAAGLDANPVHDLRVAIRRCRSLADGLRAMDPDPSWKQMKRAGKKLFRALGALRDMHVMQKWIEKLSSADDPVAEKLLAHLHAREAGCKQEALQELQQFDRKQWRQWSRSLPRRAARVRPGSMVFKHLALEKWTVAYDLHKRAMRSRSQTAWHELRMGIKRFRYTVENFLPREHAAWAADLKDLQDFLGEVHDLDVLWNMAVRIAAFPDLESRSRWRQKLNEERSKRLDRYRERMVGKQSFWRMWREELPSGPQLRTAATARLRIWASYLDPDRMHSQRVAQLSLSLYDGLKQAGLMTQNHDHNSRAVLHVAALLHDVGKAKGDKAHHKDSFRMIRNLTPPLGWSEHELQLAAVIARYHRGALPRPRQKSLHLLDLLERRVALQLAGVLRLTNSLDTRNGTEPRLKVGLDDKVVLIQTAGYSPLDRSAEEIAAARHLLEVVLRRPVLVRSLRETAPGPKPHARGA
jgi:exopolyphosphatase/guanosine-5'-triphosphate,3'-diphosphate pyrophosphatase